MITGLPAAACSASVVSNSTTISRRRVSPISSTGAPATSGVSLVWVTRITRPEIGARNTNGSLVPLPRCATDSAASACSTACAATRRASIEASRFLRDACSARRSASRRYAEMNPPRASSSLRNTSFLACASATSATPTCDCARSASARAAATRARNSRSVRSSCNGGSTGRNVATIAPASTTSPSRSVMRASTPVSGATTT
jgi:hypothetical protein